MLARGSGLAGTGLSRAIAIAARAQHLLFQRRYAGHVDQIQYMKAGASNVAKPQG